MTETTVQAEYARLAMPEIGFVESESDIVEAEAFFGVRLPEDYRWWLLETGGLDLQSPLLVRVPNMRRIGEVMCGSACEFWQSAGARGFDYILPELRDTWAVRTFDVGVDPQWWSRLLPVSPISYNKFWCLDLRYSETEPPVILIDHVSDPFPRLLSWARYVAPSFTQMLRQSAYFEDSLGPEATAFSERDSAPYEFAEQALAWAKSSEAYLAEYGAYPIETMFD